MLTLAPFTFCANNVPGTDPIRAMDMARRCGFHTIELSAIDGISEQIVAERVSPEYVMQIERELQKRDLQCTALSAHCDMTDEAQFARLLKKIEFAGQIGAQLVNTRCGPKARYAVFEEHVKRAAEAADRYGLRLGLESYGDIVGPASECGGVFAELDLPHVQYTYDPGNTYRFCRGEIRLDEDLQNASVPVAYLHMKDGSIHDPRNSRIAGIQKGSGRRRFQSNAARSPPRLYGRSGQRNPHRRRHAQRRLRKLRERFARGGMHCSGGNSACPSSAPQRTQRAT